MGAITRFRTLGDYMHNKANIRAKCRCGHVGIVDTVKFKRWVDAHRYSDWLEANAGCIKCSKCKRRAISYKPPPEAPTRPDWMDREEQWAKLVRWLMVTILSARFPT